MATHKRDFCGNRHHHPSPHRPQAGRPRDEAQRVAHAHEERGNIKTDAAGGYEIRVPPGLRGKPDLPALFELDLLNISQSDVITSAKYDWMQAAIVVSSGRELKMNASKEK